jgi:DNA invertase Pin-like site-specific DNA recombinase
MQFAPPDKLTPDHLQRQAYLYVRQSTLQQVSDNRESTARQYALKKRAVELGWTEEKVRVIDEDLGQSGASSERSGFQKLCGEVGMGRVGVVMSLEVSRLARKSSDWHRLLEICAVTATLILDEDGLYDPAHFNDRLLLGLKGTMSEVELHLMRARLRGGALNKIRRGEFRLQMPAGLVYDEQGCVVLDPDQRVQDTIRLFFATFRRLGSAHRTVGYFLEQGHRFPSRVRSGPDRGEIAWKPLTTARTIFVLHNPRYAGAYVYGTTRSQRRMGAPGRTVRDLPREQWHTLILDAHPGYITWEQYEEHQRQLRDNARASAGPGGCRYPPREGPSLLQGLAVCGRCGRNMTVSYRCPAGSSVEPTYQCRGPNDGLAGTRCQHIVGGGIDRAVGELLVETMSPMALEVALVVEQELQDRVEETDRLRRQRVEQVRYEAELARRRYMRTEPEHRLVAVTLETEWNQKLGELAQAEQDYERRRQADRMLLDEETRKKILAIASDFPKLWSDPRTPHRERKRMLRLLVEDVTLLREEQVAIHVRFKGGATKTLHIDRPLLSWEARQTDSKVIAEIDRLLDDHTFDEIVTRLNRKGFVTGTGKPFDGRFIARLRSDYKLKKRYDRLRERGLLTADEIANRLGIRNAAVKDWRLQGRIKGHPVDGRGRYLYEEPDLAAGRRRASNHATLKDARGAV